MKLDLYNTNTQSLSGHDRTDQVIKCTEVVYGLTELCISFLLHLCKYLHFEKRLWNVTTENDTDDSQRKSMNNITEKSEMSNTTVLECLSVLTMEEI